ncbi:MAG: ParB/RepB/Spo0J family partition protein [Nitrospirae bacterium]|nr:ParB/RepB/Spo0J family partition protein [Nitrospirota bacterium]
MKTALGKGLEALIPEKGEEVLYLDIDRIFPGEHQPRKAFKDDSLKELAASIKERGVLQPIIVSRVGDGTFRLVTGERRWRAAALAGLKKIPALIKNVASRDSLEIALIENIQREDLNPIETAEAFRRLVTDFKLSQEELSDRVGKDRATISNYLRLLKLPEEIKSLIYSGSLSIGHAKAILAIDGKAHQMEAARKVIKKGLSVRETEALTKKISMPLKVKATKDPQISSLEEKLIRNLGTKVRIFHKGKRGKIEIEYYSFEELDRLLEILMGDGGQS